MPEAAARRRIIYISTREEQPTGGIRVLFRHVALLNQNGFSAYLLHPKQDFRPSWFEADVPMLYYGAGLQTQASDVFVLAETAFKSLRRLRQLPHEKHVFCQNHYGIFQGLGEAAHWREFGVSGVFAVSAVAARFIEACFGYGNVPVVPAGVDRGLFRPHPKKPQIAFMPRKRQRDAAFIRRTFELLYPHHQDIAWVPIQDLPEAKVAEIMGESALFLALSHREGLGLPPLEAMAAGCLVVGFHGQGGLSYANPDNGLWYEDDDLFGCAGGLGKAIEMLKTGTARVAEMRAAGQATAEHYGLEAMEKSLIAYWSEALRQGKRPGPPDQARA